LKALLLCAAVAKPGQSPKETALGEGLKILSCRGSLVQIRPAAPSDCMTSRILF
jgi:hypothetical protein